MDEKEQVLTEEQIRELIEFCNRNSIYGTGLGQSMTERRRKILEQLREEARKEKPAKKA